MAIESVAGDEHQKLDRIAELVAQRARRKLGEVMRPAKEVAAATRAMQTMTAEWDAKNDRIPATRQWTDAELCAIAEKVIERIDAQRKARPALRLIVNPRFEG